MNNVDLHFDFKFFGCAFVDIEIDNHCKFANAVGARKQELKFRYGFIVKFYKYFTCRNIFFILPSKKTFNFSRAIRTPCVRDFPTTNGLSGCLHPRQRRECKADSQLTENLCREVCCKAHDFL